MIWFYKMEQKYGKYAIRNLTWYLIICYAVGFVLQIASHSNPGIAQLMSYLTLDVYAILHGQIWRLVSWVLIPPETFDILTLVMLYCYYSIGTMLERNWGSFKYNVYMFSGLVFTIVGAFLLYGFFAIIGGGADVGGLQAISASSSHMFRTFYISMSIFLAFAITYPDAQMLFMFVIPIKTKVLGVIYVVIMIYEIYMGFVLNWLYGLTQAIVIGFSLLNVLCFFIVTRKNFRTPGQVKRAKEFERHVVKMKKASRHKCAICGITEENDEDETFRFCSKCEGNYEYCSKHIYTHVHVKKDEQ